MATTQGTDYSKEPGAFGWMERNWKNVVLFVVFGLICFFLGGWIL